MEDTSDSGVQRTVPAEQHEIKHYLPGMPRLSTEPGRVERLLTNLFRRRGGVRIVVRPKR